MLSGRSRGLVARSQMSMRVHLKASYSEITCPFSAFYLTFPRGCLHNEVHKTEFKVCWDPFILCRPSWVCCDSLLAHLLPVMSEEAWQTEIPLGIWGRAQKASFFYELTHPKCHIIAALLFHIDCERHTQRLILSLVKHRSLKVHTFKAIRSQEGPQMRRLGGPNTVRSPLNNHIWVLHLHTAEIVTICEREQDGQRFFCFLCFFFF